MQIYDVNRGECAVCNVHGLGCEFIMQLKLRQLQNTKQLHQVRTFTASAASVSVGRSRL